MAKMKVVFVLAWIFAYNCSISQSSQTFIQLVSEAEKETNAKNWKSAIPLWERINQQNPVNHNFNYQLGSAYYNAGNYGEALKAFEKGFRLSANKGYYDALDVAKTYAKMGDNISALKWIRKSFELGMPNRSVFEDEALKGLRSLSDFQELAAIKDVSHFNRTEGWRYDLNFLKDEIVRKAYLVVREFSRDDLEEEVKRIHDLIPQLTDMQVTVEFMKLLAKLRDGHTMLFVMNDNPEISKNIPVEFYWFKEGVYIIQAAKPFENLLGAKVVSIEDKAPEDVFVALNPIMSRDNDQTLKVMSLMRVRQTAILHAMGLANSPDKLSLKIIDVRGKTVSLSMEANSEISSRRLWDGLPQNWVSLENTISENPLYMTRRYTWYWFEYLKKDKTVWFQYNRVLDDPNNSWTNFLDSLFGFIEKNDVDKLVIDFRNNNGGNGELSYPLIHKIIKSEKINREGKLFIITGRKTFSAAGICIGLLEKHTKAIFAGEPAGTSPNFIGEEFEFKLPYSKLMGNISDREHHYANAVDYRVWIAPLIYVEPSIKDLVNGRDAVWDSIRSSYPLK